MGGNVQFEKTPGWLDWYAGPSKPAFRLPPGSVDAHCHVFGPGSEFPFAPERKYTPCDASKQQLFGINPRLEHLLPSSPNLTVVAKFRSAQQQPRPVPFLAS